MTLKLSTLPKTWIFDVDGTLVIHNGHLTGQDTLLDGVKKEFDRIPATDTIILLTARKDQYQKQLEEFLKAHGIRYDFIISGIPQGERIIINDRKPSGLTTAYAINKARDSSLVLDYEIDDQL